MQGRPTVCKGAQSATNVYAYDYTFCRRAIIATLDLSAEHLDAFETGHWLSSPLNVIVLKLTSKAYHEPPVLAITEPAAMPEAGVVEWSQRKRRSVGGSDA